MRGSHLLDLLIKKEECTGCLSCVAFCPRGAMFAHDELAEPFKCISCGSCVKACPSGALYLEAPMETPFPPKEGWN
ncbi:MAG: 4Fe-4S binding protein [Desulfotomaculales bacterium]